MKKLFLIILALLVLCGCGVQTETEEPQSEPEVPVNSENELGEGSKILEACIFKTADEKYGVQSEGKIIMAADYEMFKKVGQLGDKTLYALGKTEGTKPCIVWNDDGMVTGVGETERVLYDIFYSDGRMLLSFPVDDFDRYDEETLYVSLEGTLYIYTFSNDGEIVGEEVVSKGKSGESYNGLDEVQYYYGASPFSVGIGLIDLEGNEVVPAIYSYIHAPFDDRIVAGRSESGVFAGTCRILDNNGNVICGKYHGIDFDMLENEKGKFIGIAYCADENSQVATVCRDENGEIMPGGFWFVDKDGNAISEIFESEENGFVFRKGGITPDEYIITVTDKDGNKKEMNLLDYAFEP